MSSWDDEFEAYREEARNVLQFLPSIEDPVEETGPVARAQHLRKSFRERTPTLTSDLAEQTRIPGSAGEIPRDRIGSLEGLT